MSETEDRVSAWRALLIAHARTLSAIEADLAREHQIPLTSYDVLLELNSAPDRRLRMADLADRVVLSRTRVSRLVDELQADGYIERQPSPDDGRVTFAAITPSGRGALRRAAPVYLASIDRNFTSLLTHHERNLITIALNKVIEHHEPERRSRSLSATSKRAFLST